MAFRFRVPALAFLALTTASAAGFALPSAGRPGVDGAAVLRALGARGANAFAPSTGLPSALVRLPAGTSAEALGLEAMAPGIGRLRGSASRLSAFGASHPELTLELAPPLHMLQAAVADPGPGQWINAATGRLTKGVTGKGVLVGVADTGVDVTHPDLLDEAGHTRVAWLLDLSRAPTGKYKDLEEKYGIKSDSGTLIAGAVLDASDIDALIASKPGTATLPSDEVGHGTHVASIATARGVDSSTGFVGVAPEATLVFARVTRSGTESIENADLLNGVAFMFDRSDAMKQPIVVNLSVGTDFGPHDGTMLWEEQLASYVGPDKPGRAMVVAAGNSGSIGEGSVHASVHVTSGTRTRVPVHTLTTEGGSVQIWITLRPNADLKIGLESPTGEWISPIGPGQQRGKGDKDGKYTAGVIYGATVPDSPIPSGSNGAVVVWDGVWPAGDYNVTFEGRGTADLWIQAGGGAYGSGFVGGVREGTINLPASHPDIISVGCTVDRPSWTSIADGPVSLVAPLLDAQGGRNLNGTPRKVTDGEVCWFSSAGPNALGVAKPEISAPGAGVVASMSIEAAPPSAGSIFTVGNCPLAHDVRDPRCLQVDQLHAVAVGTSMSAPHVSGAIALLFERDPTLTQGAALSLLQAGAHPFRGADPFFDQAGPGELDVLGALTAQDEARDPTLALPVRANSWISASRSFVPADGSVPVTAIVELRAEDGVRPANLFDASRLAPVATLNGQPLQPAPTLVRRGPGVWAFDITVPAGLGGHTLELGATFDGAPIVKSYVSLPIATDPWMASYPSIAKGGCAFAPSAAGSFASVGVLFALAGLAATRRRR